MGSRFSVISGLWGSPYMLPAPPVSKTPQDCALASTGLAAVLGSSPTSCPLQPPVLPAGPPRPGCSSQVHPLLSGHLLHPRERAVYLLTAHWDTPTHPGSKMSLVLQPPCAEASGSLCDCYCITRVLATPKKLRVREAVGGALTPQPPVQPVPGTSGPRGDTAPAWGLAGRVRLTASQCGCRGFHFAASGDMCG